MTNLSGARHKRPLERIVSLTDCLALFDFLELKSSFIKQDALTFQPLKTNPYAETYRYTPFQYKLKTQSTLGKSYKLKDKRKIGITPTKP
jgi:hypothetical protein